MRHPNEMSKAEYFAVATHPTSNEMFDNGAWLGPVLDSTDPTVDSRANHAIHFFAEDARLSVCGNRFGPDHYVETSFHSENEVRRRCLSCERVRAAVDAGRSSAHPPLRTPQSDTYSAAEFAELIAGTVRIDMRINRRVRADGDLYLMVDLGVVPARSLRRDYRNALERIDEVVLVWAGETSSEFRARILNDSRVAAAQEVENALRQTRELFMSAAPVYPPPDARPASPTN